MVCNEANLDLILSLEQQIVVSEHNELAVVTYPWAPTGHLQVGAQWETMCLDIHEDIFSINSGLFVQ